MGARYYQAVAADGIAGAGVSVAVAAGTRAEVGAAGDTFETGGAHFAGQTRVARRTSGSGAHDKTLITFPRRNTADTVQVERRSTVLQCTSRCLNSGRNTRISFISRLCCVWSDRQIIVHRERMVR